MSLIPIIDLFAGPGGLGEGFSAYKGANNERVFNIALSIEKDYYAHKTLELRSFFRQFPQDEVPAAYYDYLNKKAEIKSPAKQDKLRTELFEKYPIEAEKAKAEAWCAELGKDEGLNDKIDKRIESILGDARSSCWGMIGGPPCQAYSVIGRARNKAIEGYSSETDIRSYLYKQYLRVLARHKPSFFIMENVKGMLSAKLNGKLLFNELLEDLRYPLRCTSSSDRNIKNNLEYSVYPLSCDSSVATRPSDYIIEAEQYGIPQTRHRVILLGVRKDFTTNPPRQLKKHGESITVKDVIGNLPKIRSGLSKYKPDGGDSKTWKHSIADITKQSWFENGIHGNVKEIISIVAADILDNSTPRGGEYIHCHASEFKQKDLTDWYLDENMDGVCNHTSRNHMISDLHRYLYSSVFAEEFKRAPLMEDYPDELLPAHKSARSGNFNDRFRVQIADKPSTTITSHISKDGHYFIHYDPEQCRIRLMNQGRGCNYFW